MTRTVLVTGLPEGSTDKEVYHHFQKKKNGGEKSKKSSFGQKKMKLPLSLKTSKVSFYIFIVLGHDRPIVNVTFLSDTTFVSSIIESNTILAQLSLITVTK